MLTKQKPRHQEGFVAGVATTMMSFFYRTPPATIEATSREHQEQHAAIKELLEKTKDLNLAAQKAREETAVLAQRL